MQAFYGCYENKMVCDQVVDSWDWSILVREGKETKWDFPT